MARPGQGFIFSFGPSRAGPKFQVLFRSEQSLARAKIFIFISVRVDLCSIHRGRQRTFGRRRKLLIQGDSKFLSKTSRGDIRSFKVLRVTVSIKTNKIKQGPKRLRKEIGAIKVQDPKFQKIIKNGKIGRFVSLKLFVMSAFF